MSKRAKQLLGVLVVVTLIAGGYYFMTARSHSVNTSGSDISSLTKTLPNGNTLDLRTLRDSRFQGLTPPNYPTVDRSEIGTGNPFK